MKRAVLFITLVLSLQLFLLACQNNNSEEEKENHEFYYYPKKNVYYDVEKKYFLYSLDGAKTWDSLMSFSDIEPATLGEKIIVYSKDNDVYKDNAAHRKSYNGTLYNIAGADTAFASATPEVAERKVQRKAVAVKHEQNEEKPGREEVKQKKGLKKFLDKIFGKHNKISKAIDSL